MRSYKLTHKKILSKTWKLFSKRSYSTLSIQEIADCLGLAKSAIFYHFKSKMNLFCEMINLHSEQVTNRVNIVFKLNINPEDKLKKIINTYLNELSNHQALVKIFYSDSFRNQKRIKNLIRKNRTEAFQKIKKTIQDGIGQGIFNNKNVDLTVKSIVSTIENSVLQQMTNKNNHDNQTTPYAINLLIKGLKND